MNSQASTAETSHRRLLDDREYVGLDEVSGPIVGVSGIHNVGYNELAEIVDRHGTTRLGMTLEVSEGAAVIQVFEGTSGLKLGDTRVRFRGHPLTLAVSEEMLGRAFDGLGRPFDGGPEPIGEERDVNGLPVNPTARDYPRKFIQTGISAIDGMNTLVRGQKLPVFSGSGLPHRQLVAQITRQARIVGEDIPFAVVFAGMGIKHDEARFYLKNFEESGAMERVAAFLSLADAPSVERLMTPRTRSPPPNTGVRPGMHVLVILTDMTNYCGRCGEFHATAGRSRAAKAIRAIFTATWPASTRARGMLRGKPGSIPDPRRDHAHDDISHRYPISGFITEGDRAGPRSRPAGHLPRLRGFLAFPPHERRHRRRHDARITRISPISFSLPTRT